MELALLLIVIVAVPVIALVWTRRGRNGGGETRHGPAGASGHRGRRPPAARQRK